MSLHERRMELGLTITQVASRACVSPVTVSRAEKGRPVRDLQLARITRALADAESPAVTEPDGIDGPGPVPDAALLADLTRKLHDARRHARILLDHPERSVRDAARGFLAVMGEDES